MRMRPIRCCALFMAICCCLAVVITVWNLPSGSKTTKNKRGLIPEIKSKYSLIIMIVSATGNVNRRRAIRDTWLKSLRKDRTVLYKFISASKRLTEAEKRKMIANEVDDFLFVDQVEDAYRNLPAIIVEAFKAIRQNYDFEYLLKVDDDSFVNVVPFLRALKKLQIDPRSGSLWWGYFAGAARVYKTGKWAEPGWVLSDRYLPYARGGGYVLSSGLVGFIAHNSALLKQYANEDVCLGAWLAGLDVWRLHDRRFDTEHVSRGCSNRYLITHKQSPEQMVSLQTNLDATGQLCSKEIGLQMSYAYNWKVLPSQCCVRDRMDTELLERDFPF